MRIYTIAGSALATLLTATALIIHSPAPARRRAMHPPAQEIDENPAERERVEWMQLRDPATGQIPRGIQRDELAFASTLPKRDRSPLAKRTGADLDWQLRGPYNVGGRTRALALDASNRHVILAGGVTGGVWRSTDDGASWSSTTSVGQLPSVTCIAQDMRAGHRDTWYYGTGEFRTNSTRFGNVQWPGNGIFKSTNGGVSWSPLPATLDATPQTLDNPFEYVNNIVVDTSDKAHDVVYAACYGAIMRSTDGGATWAPSLGGPGNNVGFTTVAIAPGGVLYAGFGSGATVRGIWRSADGVTWHNISPIGWSDSVRRITFGIAPSDPNILYVLAETPNVGLRIDGSYGYPEYYSFWHYSYNAGDGTGAGGKWSDRTLNLPQFGQLWNYNGLDSYTMHVTVAPGNPDKIYIGGTNLYESTDGLATSANVRWVGGYFQFGGYGLDGSLHPDQHALVVDPGSSSVYAGTDGGVFRCDLIDAGSPLWTPLSNGYYTTQFYSVAIDPGTPGSDLVIGGVQDNGTVMSTASDPKAPWPTLYGGDGCMCAIASGGHTMYVSSQVGNIYRIHMDDAGNLTEYVRIQPTGPTDYLFVTPFTLDQAADSILFLAAGGSLWRNSNTEGIPLDTTFQTTRVNWQELSKSRSADIISAVSTSTANPGHRVYYGTVNGKVYRLENANSGNPTPVDITGTSFPRGAYVNCIAVDPLNGSNALVVFTNYNVQSLFHTTDAGATWMAVGGNLEQHIDGTGDGPSCRWATLVHRGNAITAFVGTTTGLYSTSALDGAATVWAQEGASTIGYARVDMIAARASDGYVVAGTWERGPTPRSLPRLVSRVNG
jgi:hypothetical protein